MRTERKRGVGPRIQRCGKSGLCAVILMNKSVFLMSVSPLFYSSCVSCSVSVTHPRICLQASASAGLRHLRENNQTTSQFL